MSFLIRHARLLSVALFLGALLVIFELTGLASHFSLEFLRQRILEHKIIGTSIFVLLFSVGNLIQIPGWVFLAAAVLTLGETMGGVVTYIAASISCLVTFLTIRYIGGDALRRIDNKVAARIFSHLDARPITIVFLLRFLFQTMPVLNIALAMSGIKLRQYLIGSLLGLALPIMLYCIFFDYLGKALKIL
jgi:uncharacterized membrane protein YdjX (TVP38/TMEM64 family)